MTLLDLKEKARQYGGSFELGTNPRRRDFTFKNAASMWFFIDAIENDIQSFRLFATDRANNKVFIEI